ncbi:pyridoxal-phosphate dependent enzyme [Streptomyces tricolor]|nr:pyridoxal-phosphate dependent enzyme [Streptomyces tricolor]
MERGTGPVESTSGNLGLALAALAAAHRVPFTAVVDPRTSAALLYDIRALGARVVTVHTPDGAGGHLLNRLARVRALLREQPGLVWTDQYNNPANPAAHATGTAPELHWQTRGEPMSVLVAAVPPGAPSPVSGGTAAEPGAAWELVGGGRGPVRRPLGGPAGPPAAVRHRLQPPVRLSARRPPAHGVRRPGGGGHGVPAWLRATTGIGVGASSGAVVAAALRLFPGRRPARQRRPSVPGRRRPVRGIPSTRRSGAARTAWPGPARCPACGCWPPTGRGPLTEGVRW